MRRALITLLAVCASLISAPAQAEASRLTLAFIPQENPDKLIRDVDKITAYLEDQLGIPVEGFVTADHAAAVEALKTGEADVSFMGGLPYVIAHARFGAEVVLAEVYRGEPYYRGRIFVRKDSGITKPAQLQDKSIAFADPISESGYLYPLQIFVERGLLEAGSDPQTFFGQVYFAGGYQQAIQAMANGLVDAAGVSEFSDLLLTPAQQDKVKWIAQSQAIPSHTVVVRPGLKAALQERFVEAMLQLNEPAYQHLLQYVYGPDGYVRASHSDYLDVVQLARKHGYLE